VIINTGIKENNTPIPKAEENEIEIMPSIIDLE